MKKIIKNIIKGLCKAARTFQTLNYTASVFFLTAMSIDRYIAVAYTTRARQVRNYIHFIHYLKYKQLHFLDNIKNHTTTNLNFYIF